MGRNVPGDVAPAVDVAVVVADGKFPSWTFVVMIPVRWESVIRCLL